MPATLESPATGQDDIAATPSARNPFIYDQPLRTASLMNEAGLLDDAAMTESGWLKRITRAIARDYTKDGFDDHTGQRIALWQEDFKRKLAGMDYETLVADGQINKLVEARLEALADYHRGKVTLLDTMPVSDPEQRDPAAFNRIHEREEKLAAKYLGDLKYVREHADTIRQTALKYPDIVKNAQDLPFGELVTQAGLIDGDKTKARDMVDDVLATGVAHSIRTLAHPLKNITRDELQSWQENPGGFETQIRALADKLRANTTALPHVHLHDDSTPELKQMQGLRDLLSAQMHAALDPQQSPEALIETLVKIEPVVNDYRNVTMSLAHHFLGKGPGADDPRMQSFRAKIGEALDGDILPFEHAEAKAHDLARSSAQDLMQKAEGKPELEARLRGLLGQVSPELAEEKLESKPGLIGSSVQAAVGALLKMTDKLRSTLGIGQDNGATRGAV